MSKILRMNPYPEAYNAEWVRMDYRCLEEVYNIVIKSGNIEAFKAHFKVRHEYLQKHWEYATSHRQWFERLSHEAGLYSLHMASINNMRILYVLHGSEVWHLCAFAEKESGKRQSYKRYIPIARQRLKEILEEEDG